MTRQDDGRNFRDRPGGRYYKAMQLEADVQKSFFELNYSTYKEALEH